MLETVLRLQGESNRSRRVGNLHPTSALTGQTDDRHRLAWLEVNRCLLQNKILF